jgi:hypothetical protein
MGPAELIGHFGEHRTALLVCGIAGGWLLVMLANPARKSLADGWRAVRRYPALWLTFAILGFCGALFEIALRVHLYLALAPAQRSEFAFRWFREAWRDPDLWLTGSPESLWWLTRNDFVLAAHHSLLPTIENVAGLFNMPATFPVSALAAVLLLVNWQGHQGVLFRALGKRFGPIGWLMHLGVVVCALAAMAKPLLYAAPLWLGLRENAAAAEAWFRWAPVVEWLAFLFESLFGVFVQLCLILLAYIWVRGLSFTPQHLVDFALRRFSFVLKWAAFVMLASSIFINAPLILKNFTPFERFLPQDETAITHYQKWARFGIAAFILLGATIQITLTFHGESLRKAVRDHFRFLATHWWPFAWFLVAAGIHIFALNLLRSSVEQGVGEGTTLWVVWKLVFPWPAGAVTAWLLASWVNLFHRCDEDRVHAENSTKHS